MRRFFGTVARVSRWAHDEPDQFWAALEGNSEIPQDVTLAAFRQILLADRPPAWAGNAYRLLPAEALDLDPRRTPSLHPHEVAGLVHHLVGHGRVAALLREPLDRLPGHRADEDRNALQAPCGVDRSRRPWPPGWRRCRRSLPRRDSPVLPRRAWP